MGAQSSTLSSSSRVALVPRIVEGSRLPQTPILLVLFQNELLILYAHKTNEFHYAVKDALDASTPLQRWRQYAHDLVCREADPPSAEVLQKFILGLKQTYAPSPVLIEGLPEQWSTLHSLTIQDPERFTALEYAFQHPLPVDTPITEKEAAAAAAVANAVKEHAGREGQGQGGGGDDDRAPSLSNTSTNANTITVNPHNSIQVVLMTPPPPAAASPSAAMPSLTPLQQAQLDRKQKEIELQRAKVNDAQRREEYRERIAEGTRNLLKDASVKLRQVQAARAVRAAKAQEAAERAAAVAQEKAFQNAAKAAQKQQQQEQQRQQRLGDDDRAPTPAPPQQPRRTPIRSLLSAFKPVPQAQKATAPRPPMEKKYDEGGDDDRGPPPPYHAPPPAYKSAAVATPARKDPFDTVFTRLPAKVSTPTSIREVPSLPRSNGPLLLKSKHDQVKGDAFTALFARRAAAVRAAAAAKPARSVPLLLKSAPAPPPRAPGWQLKGGNNKPYVPTPTIARMPPPVPPRPAALAIMPAPPRLAIMPPPPPIPPRTFGLSKDAAERKYA